MDPRGGRLKVNDDEARTVRAIFELDLGKITYKDEVHEGEDQARAGINADTQYSWI